MDLTESVVRNGNACGGGSYADIFLGSFRLGAEIKVAKVAIKVIRAHIYTNFDRHKLLKVVKLAATIVTKLKLLSD